MLSIKGLLLSSLITLSPTLVTALSACPGGQLALVASAVANYPPALSYCSSKYPVAPQTSTATATTTATTTVATSTLTTTVATTTITITAPATTTTIIVATETDTITDTTVVTTTSTETDTETTTTTVRALQKRGAPVNAFNPWSAAPTPVKPTKPSPPNSQASAWSGLLSQASSIIKTICVCIETQSTVTSTTTTGTTTSVTATSTASVTETDTTTTTPVVTSSVTDTTTITTTSTSTETDTATTTTTITVTATVTPPSCNVPNTNIAGAGGCSSNCYCDSDSNGVNNYCTSDITCNAQCSTDADCAPTQFCTNRPDAIASCGYQICESTDGCSSSLTKRTLFGLGGEERAGRIMARVTEARSKWHEARSADCSRASICAES